MHFNWLRSLLADNRSAKRTSRMRRPCVSEVETLETRAVPAIYHVTGMTDGAGVISASGIDFNASTLRAAINDANLQPGDDTIVLPSGTYTINTDGEGELLITSNITIDGAGAANTTIDNGYRVGRVFHITGGNTQVVTIEGVTITQGSVEDEGAGILLDGGTLNLDQSTVTANFANAATGNVYGAGISVNSATLNVTDSTISYNSAYGGDGAANGEIGDRNGYLAAGGGIATRLGTVNVLRSTIDHNNVYGGGGTQFGYHAGDAQGGGIASLSGSTLIIQNSTIANNSANGGNALNEGQGYGGNADGGGLYAADPATITNSTIAYNNVVGGLSAERTVGIANGGGAAVDTLTSIGSTIIAQNTTSRNNPDISGLIVSLDNNLIGDIGSSQGWSGLSDLLGGNGGPAIDPLFTSNFVIDNGGLTFTLGLQATSPAINAGSIFESLTSDQRGLPYVRAFGLADIGAFELQGPAIATTPGSTAFTAGSPAIVVDAGVSVFDTESLTSATVTISGSFIAGEDVLAYPTVIGNITGSYLNGVLTLTGEDTAANYQLALRSVTYQNTNSDPQTADRTISFAGTDSVGTTTPAATRVVTVDIVETGPTITLSEVQGTYHIGKNTALVSPLATFTNDGQVNPDFSAAQLTVSITSGRSSKDVLSVLAKGDPSGHIRVKGRNLFYDNVKIGTVSGGKGRQPNLVVTFNAQASNAAVDALVRRVNITAKDQIGQIRTVQFQITNISGVDSNIATRDIQVVPMNGIIVG